MLDGVEMLLDLRLQHLDPLLAAVALGLRLRQLHLQLHLAGVGRLAHFLNLHVQLAIDLRLSLEHPLRSLHLPLELEVSDLQLLEASSKAGNRVFFPLPAFQERHGRRVLMAPPDHREGLLQLDRVDVVAVDERERAWHGIQQLRARFRFANLDPQGIELPNRDLLLCHQRVSLVLKLCQGVVVRLCGLAKVRDLELLLFLPLLGTFQSSHPFLILVCLGDEGRLAEPLDLVFTLPIALLQLPDPVHQVSRLACALLRGLLVLHCLLQRTAEIAHLLVHLFHLLEGSAVQLQVRLHLGLDVIVARLQQLVPSVGLSDFALERKDLFVFAADRDALPCHGRSGRQLLHRSSRLRRHIFRKPSEAGILLLQLVPHGLCILQMRT
eukprot:scaffold7341_cov229-Pinguiococcus_pyrenoidosus.AAC.5